MNTYCSVLNPFQTIVSLIQKPDERKIPVEECHFTSKGADR